MLAGQTILARTLAAFDTHPDITAIVVVAGADEIERIQDACKPFAKVCAVVAGGVSRTASVKNGLNALPPDIGLVLVHDAARPLVSRDLISRVIAGTLAVGAAVPGLPLSDTVKRVGSDNLVRATIPRSDATDTASTGALSGLTTVQTPQGAAIALLRAAYATLDIRASAFTDEASLIEALGKPVAIVPGDAANLKLTRLEDLALAEQWIASQNPPAPLETRTGFGYDVHAFAAPEANRPLFLGGIEIPHDRGLEGHSDADVLLHAICDALLGAASLGDIGILFPNTDAAYKNISSLKLLEIVHSRLQEAGWDIINIDAAIVAEAPKIMPHRRTMQETIATCLSLSPTRVSVKATTSEGMGFVGRREGMACWAVATLRTKK